MNILLITIDTLRADHLECYGYPKETSPTLARLAAEGVVFEQCFAPTMPTTPSFTSILTSVDAYGHQIVNVVGDVALDPSFRTLPQLLQETGWHTAAVDNKQQPWFAWGFDQHVIGGFGLDQGARVKRSMEEVSQQAEPILEELRRRDRWFLWLHPWDPHTPYWPPPPYDRLFYSGDERDPANLSMRAPRAFVPFSGAYEHWFGLDVTDIQYGVALYDGEIRYNSDHLGALLERMKRLGLWEDTLVIATSDHGEILDQHPGQFDHHGLFDDNLRVPLIVRFPGDEHAGQRVDALVSNVDLAPTVCDCLGLQAPSQFEGQSLLPLIRGERAEQYPELYLGEATYQCKRGVRTREWKLIRALSTSVRHNWHGDGRKELYHLPSDPWEQTNLIHMWPSVARELEARLDRWLDAQRAKWGHEDPIKVQGISIARRMLKAQLKRDRERDWEIR